MSTWLAVRPVGALATRDGRGFSAGINSEGGSVFPRPSTVAGAVAAAVGGTFVSVQGPFIVDERAPEPRLLLPSPKSLLINKFDDRSLVRVKRLGVELTDLPLAGVCVGDGTAASRWIDAGSFAPLLNGDPGDLASVLFEEPYSIENRVGLWREDGRVASDSYLYSMENLVLEDGFSFAVRYEGPHVVGQRTVQLGGEARLATVEEVSFTSDPLPLPPAEFPGGRLLVYLASPGIFESGWCPPLPEDATVVAACVAGPMPVGTFGISDQTRKGVRQLNHAVEAGSVYFLEFGTPESAKRWSRERAGTALPYKPESSSENPRRQRFETAGFNVAFTGIWSYDSVAEQKEAL